MATGNTTPTGSHPICVAAKAIAVTGRSRPRVMASRRSATLGEPHSTTPLVVVMVTVAVPLGEEFLFRGFVFRALSNWRGTASTWVEPRLSARLALEQRTDNPLDRGTRSPITIRDCLQGGDARCSVLD